MKKSPVFALVASIGFVALQLALAPAADAKKCTPDQELRALEIHAQISEACPCDMQANGQPWRNHGKYVSCVARTSNSLYKQNPDVARSCKKLLRRCAARSTCGKEGAVRCCFGREHDCLDDTVPGDSVADGECTNDSATACDTNADCMTIRCKIDRRGVERCTERGGVANGTGSCCNGCAPAP